MILQLSESKFHYYLSFLFSCKQEQILISVPSPLVSLLYMGWLATPLDRGDLEPKTRCGYVTSYRKWFPLHEFWFMVTI